MTNGRRTGRVVKALTSLAASGLAPTMIGAALTHIKRGEYGTILVVNAVLLVLALVAFRHLFVHAPLATNPI